MTYTKKGFTLFEILIVIALTGLFFMATSYLTHDARIGQTNTERFANKIYDIIRNTRNDMTIGRGVLSGSSLVATKQRDISISNTGIVITYQYGNGSTGTDFSLPHPFFDNDSRYRIIDIAVSSGGLVGNTYSWDHTGATDANISIGGASDITITANKGGSPIVYTSAVIRSLRITTEYEGFTRSVVIDRASGTVEIQNVNN